MPTPTVPPRPRVLLTNEDALRAKELGVDELHRRRLEAERRHLAAEQEIQELDTLLAAAARTAEFVDGTAVAISPRGRDAAHVSAVDATNHRRADPYPHVLTRRWHVRISGDRDVCGSTDIVLPHPNSPGLTRQDALDLATRWVANGPGGLHPDELPHRS